MRENIKQTLMKATFEVFEKMFFLFLEPVEKVDMRDASVSCITFGGAATGRVSLTISPALASMMAENMLGCERCDITDRMIEDCAKEAANMVCGNFLRKMDEKEVFQLHLPMYAAAEQEDRVCGNVPAGADDVTVCFESEGAHLQVRLSWMET